MNYCADLSRVASASVGKLDAERRNGPASDAPAAGRMCPPALREFELASGTLTVINNGAAGMPNFFGTRFGLISRIATRASPHPPLYGTARDGVFIDALAVRYDADGFLERFLARWPEGSAAHASYLRRLAEGPDHAIATAWPLR